MYDTTIRPALSTERPIDEAKSRGVASLYRLPTTAENYFPSLGFEIAACRSRREGIEEGRGQCRCLRTANGPKKDAANEVFLPRNNSLINVGPAKARQPRDHPSVCRDGSDESISRRRSADIEDQRDSVPLKRIPAR